MRYDNPFTSAVWPSRSVLSLLTSLAMTSPGLAEVSDEPEAEKQTLKVNRIAPKPVVESFNTTSAPETLKTKGIVDERAGEPDETEFDWQALKTNGIDPRVAGLFRNAPRFLPGETTVTLTVNGQARGKVKVRFDDSSTLCIDKDFLKKAGLVSPPGFSSDMACFDLKSAWPQTEFNADPGEERIELVVPPQAVSAPGMESDNWNHGGVAGMLNYDAQYMDSSGQAAEVEFMQFSSEVGFNASDWIVRSRQTFSRFNGEDTMQHQAAYAQRSFAGVKKVLQAGQVSLSNSMFGTGQVLGFQIFPEAALQGNRGGAGLVEGIADSQSVVEVRQSGALIYSTTVPAGPFRLQGFSLLNTRSNLDVTLTDSNGQQRQFIVPASALLLNGTAVAPGMSFGAGKLEQQGSSESPVIGTVASGWMLDPKTMFNAGLLGSTPYRAGAVGIDLQLLDATLLLLQTTVANDDKHGHQGVSITASLNHNLAERVSFNLNASHQTSGYRELSDALQDDESLTNDRSRNQIGGGISWSQNTLGSLSLSWARTRTFNGDMTQYVRGSWSKQFDRTYVGVSLEHDTGSRNLEGEDRLFITVSIPFGDGGSFTSYLNDASRSSRGGIRYSDRLSRDRGWSVSSERDFRNEHTSATGSVDAMTPVSQLSGTLSHDSDNYTSWSARATGGMVAHEDGLTLSPYSVGDTFGIAKVGDESGVRLDTPGGSTWTDRKGYAVLPAVSGFKRSTIQVDTRSLAKNVDITNAWQETEAARGSVNYVDFDVVRTRRVLVDVRNEQGKSLPQGASIFDASGSFITVVDSNSNVFVPDASQSGLFEVQTSGNTLCFFSLLLPEKADMSGLYETASAVCR